MRQREHNASNEDDNILTARKDEHCFRTPVKLLQRLCRVQRVLAGTPQTGVAPRCNLTRESAGLQTDSNCDTTESNAEQPIMRGRVLLDKHSHGHSEPRTKHQFANKVTKPIRRFRAAKYTPRKSTSLFISCDKHT